MKFFVLKNPKAGLGTAVTDFVPVDGVSTGEAPRCPVCGRFLGMRPILPPARVEIDLWGSEWGDIAFGPGDQILVSDRLKQAASGAGIVGFVRLDPVTVEKAKRRRHTAPASTPTYWLASIARSRAMVDGAASGLERSEATACPDCALGGIVKRIVRVVLRADTWSGEDVFFARGLPGTILVSERFRSVCADAGFLNCEFADAESFSFDHYPHENSARQVETP